MKKLMPISALLLAGLLIPLAALGDGGFLVYKFVWDKYKDINEPTQKAIIVYDAGQEDLMLQVKYEGLVDEFGWLIPVPNQPTVQEGSMKCFYEVSQLTQRRIEPGLHMAPAGLLSMGRSAAEAEPPVKVIELKTVGAYEVAVLSAKDSGALTTWLKANQFYFPAEKKDVLDSYVEQQWYFVAVRINLSKSGGFRLLPLSREAQNEPAAGYGVRRKLASGELNPLQISFRSDRCVFPLRISSINGRASEVQVYVLSTEPLLERTILERNLPLIYSNDMAVATRRARSMRNQRLLNLALQLHAAGATLHGPESLPPLSTADEKELQQEAKTPEARPDDLQPFMKVTKTDLRETSKRIARLEGKAWWLTKRTWTFQPEEMRDLVFEPAFPAFTRMLDSRYGYFAAASLRSFGNDAVPTIITIMQSSNSAIRVKALAAIFDQGVFPIHDSRLTEAAVGWLKDSEPQVRGAAVSLLTEYSNWNPKNAGALVAMLRDRDAGVRHTAIFTLPQFRSDMEKFIPAIQEMLEDKNPDIRASGLETLCQLQPKVPREELLSFLKSTDREVLGMAFAQLRTQDEKLSDRDSLPLLENPEPMGRLLGLRILDQNREKRSVELALSLLLDPNELVRLRAAQTLQGLTGQQFTEDQSEEWAKWWREHKSNFTVANSGQ